MGRVRMKVKDFVLEQSQLEEDKVEYCVVTHISLANITRKGHLT